VFHLLLVGILALAMMFWISLVAWIGVRLARTAKKNKEHLGDAE
jgi:hypothetical protein